MQAISIQSGSNGNAIYIEAGGVKLLIDAGVSGKRAAERLAACGRDIRDVDALLISHDHSDHLRCGGIYQRKFGLPMHVTRKTLDAAGKLSLGALGEVHHFHAGETITLGAATIETLPTPHDGVDGVAFVIEAEGKRLGVLTDLGHVFPALEQTLATLDAVFLESNYDESMLSQGFYPAFLKKRIRGEGGHISNVESAELLARHGSRLQWAVLSHLSGDNNDPLVAMATHREILGHEREMHFASRAGVSGPFVVS